MPASKNCMARVVLPVPGFPSTRYRWPFGNPPCRISSKPETPVFSRSLLSVSVADRGPFWLETEKFLIIGIWLFNFPFYFSFWCEYKRFLDSQLGRMFA